MSKIKRFAFLYLLLQVAFLSHYAQTTHLTGDAAQVKKVQTAETPSFIVSPAATCLVTGTSPVLKGSSHTYTLSAGCTATSWTVTCGSLDAWSSTTATVIFDDNSCTTAYITAVGSGAHAKGVAIRDSLTLTARDITPQRPAKAANEEPTVYHSTKPMGKKDQAQ